MTVTDPAPPPPPPTSLPRHWWWFALAQAVLLALFAVDVVPALRGYKPWPPEWRWLLEWGHHLWGLVPVALLAAVIGAVGWFADAARRRGAQLAGFAALCGLTVLLQLAAISVRGPLPITVANRTTVFFLEDFFHAAAALDAPSQAFSDFDRVRVELNQNRVATHPPGLIFAYRALLTAAPERASTAPFEHPPGSGIPISLISHDEVRPLTGREATALLWGSLLKLLGGPMMIAGVWLLVAGLRTGELVRLHGRLCALAALVPGTALFTVSLDQLVTGFSTLAVGGLVHGVCRGKWWSIVLAALALFSQSMLAFQVNVTLFIAVVTALLWCWQSPRQDWRAALLRLALFGCIAFACWLLLWALTGYSFFIEAWRGLGAHRHFAIHTHRERLPWVLWNVWDMAWFLGVALWPLLMSRATWRPTAGNPLLLAILAAWVLLTLGDGVRGETARILLFFFPLLVVAAGVLQEKALAAPGFIAASCLLTIQLLVFAAALNLF